MGQELSRPLAIKELPGIGPLTVRVLLENSVHTIEDLAKVDPYDERFKVLGENLLTYVYYARKAIADQTIKEVTVTPSYIKVVCGKEFDEESTRKAVMGRLEIYDLYVDCKVKEYHNRREFIFTLKPELARYALADWNQYRFLASELQRQIQVREMRVKKQTKPAKPVSIGGIVEGLPSPLRELLESFLLIQFSSNFNLLILLDKDSFNRSLLRNFLKAYALKHVHWICGNREAEDLGMALLSATNGTIFIDDPHKATPPERALILSLLSSGKVVKEVSEDLMEIPVNANLVCMVQLEGRKMPDREMLELFHLIIRIPPLSKGLQLQQVELLKPKEDERFREEVRTKLNFKPAYMAVPESVLSNVKRYNPPKELAGFSVRLKEAIELLALGNAKLAGSPNITLSDYKKAWRLVQTSLQTLSSKRKRL